MSNLMMMSRPTDKPMARAEAHLAAGRYAEAVGAFRAVLGIDSSAIPARLGLADALTARGQRTLAVDGLIEAAEACAERQQHDRALVLYAKALALDPARMDLHLDVAVIEHAMGRVQAAVARVEGLAERYMLVGRTDEAAEILRFASSWDEDEEAEAEDEGETTIEEIEEIEAERTVVARNPLLRERSAAPAPQVQTETVVCATVLIRPDGSLWLGPSADAGTPEVDEAEPTVARAVSAPARPKPGARSAHDTIPTRPRSLQVGAMPRPANGPRATQVSAPARSALRTAPASARPTTPTSPRAAEPAPAPASPALVERLRKRAGLDPEATATPSPASTKPGTEPIVIRRPAGLGRPDDDVTHRFRNPGAPGRAAAG